jgi:hypothetical protein
VPGSWWWWLTCPWHRHCDDGQLPSMDTHQVMQARGLYVPWLEHSTGDLAPGVWCQVLEPLLLQYSRTPLEAAKVHSKTLPEQRPPKPPITTPSLAVCYSPCHGHPQLSCASRAGPKLTPSACTVMGMCKLFPAAQCLKASCYVGSVRGHSPRERCQHLRSVRARL